MPARPSGFAISDILDLNDAKPSQEETDVQGRKVIILNSCINVIKKKNTYLISLIALLINLTIVTIR